MRSTIDFLILMGTDQRVVLRPTSHEDGVADLGLWLLLGRGDLQRKKTLYLSGTRSISSRLFRPILGDVPLAAVHLTVVYA